MKHTLLLKPPIRREGVKLRDVPTDEAMRLVQTGLAKFENVKAQTEAKRVLQKFRVDAQLSNHILDSR
jgi:hypothetical protein